MTSVGAELRVRGLVQGVGYRYFARRRAAALGLTGWVRNEPDGSVLILAEGDQGAIADLAAELKAGPSAAAVSDVTVTWREFTGRYSSFDIQSRHSW